MTTSTAVDELFAKRDPVARAIYDRLLAKLKSVGAVKAEPNKSSIHLVAGSDGSAFGGVHPRKSGILLNVRTDARIDNERVRKVEQVSRSRFHNEMLLDSPDDVDDELIAWLRDAYALAKK